MMWVAIILIGIAVLLNWVMLFKLRNDIAELKEKNYLVLKKKRK